MTSREADESEVRVLPELEETLVVDKIAFDRGGYRLTKRVELRDQTVDQVLNDETVQIERRPLGTPLIGLEAPASRYEGDTLIIPVVQEVLVTEKRLILVEEVRVKRVRGTRLASQTVSLRKERIDVERLAADSPNGTVKDPFS